MHVLFADESGTPPKPGSTYPRYFVVGAVIIPETVWHRVRDALLGMKIRRKIRGEFKWRYFAPGNDDALNPMRRLPPAERDSIREELYRLICSERAIRTLAAVCSTAAAYKMPSITDQAGVYHLTYKTLTERFQYHLQDLSRQRGAPEYGMVVSDHRSLRDDKGLRLHHQKLLHASAEFISSYKNLVESLFLQPSHLSIGIQLADMIAGGVWRKFERNDDRWYRMLEPSLRRSSAGTVEGFGLIKVPLRGWT